jgi:7-cyano-7-deazaguanine synthase in queuosine biosynthesis
VPDYSVVIDGAPSLGGQYNAAYSVRMRPDAPNTEFHVQHIVDVIGRPLFPYEDDWLDLLWAIQTADLICHRGQNEDYIRRIHLAIRLREPERFDPLLPLIRSTFNRLAHDALQITLSPLKAVTTPRFPRATRAVPDAVGLMSGGLDSACSSIEVARSASRPLFVSFRGSPHVQRAQRAVFNTLPRGEIVSFGLTVNQRHPLAPLPQPDPSQRSRTLLYAGVAALIAAAHSLPQVTLAENGVMAVNCPLTPGRISGFSTQTAHPDALSLMSQLFSAVFATPVVLTNPLIHMTKTEVVKQIVRRRQRALIPLTHSCWNTRHAAHCGTCVPCLVRRFATEAANVKDVTYEADVFRTLPARHEDRFGNLMDYLMFARTLKTFSDEDLFLEFSELTVAGGPNIAGPILEAHRRWADDVLKIAAKYPPLKALI